MSEQWEIELAAIDKRRDEIADQIKALHQEDDELNRQSAKYRNLIMQRDHDMSVGDKLLITDEFRVMLRARSGWHEAGRNSFLNARYLSLGGGVYNDYGYVYVEDTGSGTGNVPMDMIKRMHKAWLAQETK